MRMRSRWEPSILHSLNRRQAYISGDSRKYGPSIVMASGTNSRKPSSFGAVCASITERILLLQLNVVVKCGSSNTSAAGQSLLRHYLTATLKHVTLGPRGLVRGGLASSAHISLGNGSRLCNSEVRLLQGISIRAKSLVRLTSVVMFDLFVAMRPPMIDAEQYAR